MGRDKLRKVKGQALVEYLLMLMMGVFLVIMINNAFRKTIIKMWGFYFRQISAACPGCPPNPNYRMR